MTEGVPETDGFGAAPSRRRMRLLVGLGLLAILAAGVAGTWLIRDRQTMVDAADDAETAARGVATSMLTYSFESLDEDFAWVERDGTDRFQESFQQSADSVKEIAASSSATSGAVILGSGVHVEDDDEATVLVAVDSTITKRVGLPIVERWRVQLSMVKQDGRWLVDEIELL